MWRCRPDLWRRSPAGRSNAPESWIAAGNWRRRSPITFEDPADLIRVLSAERVRVIRAVREKPEPVSELAVTLQRDRKAVKWDVSLLEAFGLVKAREEINPGHGRKRTIEPRAAKYRLIATI